MVLLPSSLDLVRYAVNSAENFDLTPFPSAKNRTCNLSPGDCTISAIDPQNTFSRLAISGLFEKISITFNPQSLGFTKLNSLKVS